MSRWLPRPRLLPSAILGMALLFLAKTASLLQGVPAAGRAPPLCQAGQATQSRQGQAARAWRRGLAPEPGSPGLKA